MSSHRGVEIENLFWILAYAWDEFPVARSMQVGFDKPQSPLTPFAACFVAGAESLVKQGYIRGYQKKTERTARLKGRLRFDLNVRQAAENVQLWCTFDELSTDVLPNQVIRTTLRHINSAEDLEPGVRERARKLDRLFGEISLLTSLPQNISAQALGPYGRKFGFLMELAQFILRDVRPSQNGTGARFFDLDVQSTISNVFEQFVRNFYKRNLSCVEVRKTKRSWADVVHLTDQARALLPKLETDVVLTKGEHTMVIDTKFYAETLRRHFDKERARESHLYQMMGYLHNMSRSGQFGEIQEGLLLYPLAQHEVYAEWIIHGHRVRLVTLDLGAPWDSITARMLELVDF